MARIYPITCDDAIRQIVAAAGKLGVMELNSTSDQIRLFLNAATGQIQVGGPAFYDDIASASEMLALTLGNVSDVQGKKSVFPLDFCYRTDTGSFWMCVSNRGQTLADWREFAGGSQAAEDTIDGMTPAHELTDIIDGGGPADEFTEIIDGNDPV